MFLTCRQTEYASRRPRSRSDRCHRRSRPLGSDRSHNTTSRRCAGSAIYAGEGLVGLAWAFLRAGAGNVVGGLWNVADSSTAEMMESFYAGLAAGQAPAEALRAAKLNLIASGGNHRKPFYWAPFQIHTTWPS